MRSSSSSSSFCCLSDCLSDCLALLPAAYFYVSALSAAASLHGSECLRKEKEAKMCKDYELALKKEEGEEEEEALSSFVRPSFV